MLILARHGSTSLNGADGKERSRGWLPVPLDLQGMHDAQAAAEKISRVRGDVVGLHTSDLPRAVQTAHEIGMALGLPIQPTEALRDWNVGSYAGQPIDQILPHTQRLIDNPDEPAHNGESYNAYMQRAIPFLRQLIEDPRALHVAVSHNRITTLAHALAVNGGSHPDPDVLKGKGPVKPGGFMMIDPGWGIPYTDSPQDAT